jgi:2-polyprenyl-3-methyl-5-hydroxy-6-metoxy-1,4-benzoquinol methylase
MQKAPKLDGLAQSVGDRTAVKSGQWHETAMGLLYEVEGRIQFCDDFDHFRNGVVRLLEVPTERVIALIERTVQLVKEGEGKLISDSHPEKVIPYLKAARKELFPESDRPLTMLGDSVDWGTNFKGSKADTIFAGSISGDSSRAVVGNKKDSFAWLVAPSEQKAVHPNSIVYDTAYYDDKPVSHYGMKKYLQQLDWRSEKARRLINLIVDNSGERKARWLANPEHVKLLDVGSATGLFRSVAAEKGFSHYGIDLSEDAIALGKEHYGYETWHGGIFDLEKFAGDHKFDVVTMFDLIEHIDRHVDSMKILADLLSDDGIVVVRTPNLEAFEADVLGDHYYSFKFDHTSYFSVPSLNELMKTVGLEPCYVETSSHIFKGLLGADFLFQMGKKNKGADIIAFYKKVN